MTTGVNVIVKTMTTEASFERVFDFLSDIRKSMEIGGAAKNLAKGEDGWWLFDHVVAGKSKMKHTLAREFGIADHIFAGGGLVWHVFVRIIAYGKGSVVTWTFLKPDGMDGKQFEEQLNTGFEAEIKLWKKVLDAMG